MINQLIIAGIFLSAVCNHTIQGTQVFKLESTAFTDGGIIPSHYTCDGDDKSPPLSWSGMPQSTRSLVLIVDDPDAPDPAKPQRVWVHWVLYNLPPSLTELTGGVATLPTGAEEGLNDWNRTGYGGPCPPIGRHRYFFKLYALDRVLHMTKKPTKAQIEKAMTGHVLEQATLMGLYERRLK